MTEVWGARLAARDGKDTTQEQSWREEAKAQGAGCEMGTEKPTQVKCPLFFLKIWCLRGNPVSRDRDICINLCNPLFCRGLSQVRQVEVWAPAPRCFCSPLCEQMLCAGCSLLFLAGGSSNKILNSAFRWRRVWVGVFLGALCAAIA